MTGKKKIKIDPDIAVQVISDWKTKPHIRAEFKDVFRYYSWLKQEKKKMKGSKKYDDNF